MKNSKLIYESHFRDVLLLKTNKCILLVVQLDGANILNLREGNLQHTI